MVSIIIVSFHAVQELLVCLESIQRSATTIPHEVILVDNASLDGTVEAVRARFPAVQLIVNDENVGFSQANNQALGLACGEHTLFLNPDTELRPGALERMLAALEEVPGCVAVGPRLVNPDGSVWRMCARRLPTLWTEFCQLLWLDRLFPRSRLLARKYYGNWDRQADRDVECLVGAALVCRTGQVRDLGGFDESVPLFLDDVDVCRRLGEFGRLRYVSDAEVMHYHNVSGSSQSSALLKRISLQATYRYFAKHRSRAEAAAYAVLVAGVGVAGWGLALVRYLVGSRDAARRTRERATVFVDWAVRPKARTYELPRALDVDLVP